MSQYWFRPKTYGYGATPSTWQGWGATAAFGAVVGIPALLLAHATQAGATPRVGLIVGWLAVVVALTVAFVAFCRAKTDGQWRWRWGK